MAFPENYVPTEGAYSVAERDARFNLVKPAGSNTALIGDTDGNKARVANVTNAAAIGTGLEVSGYGLVFGKYNVHIPTPGHLPPGGQGYFIEEVGNGTDEDNRSNARTLDWGGNEWLAGKLTLGALPTGEMDAATKKYVDDAVSSKPSLTNSTTPVIDGKAAVGKSSYAARADHVHPVDTGRQSHNALRNAYFKNPINSRGRGTGSTNKVNSTDSDPYIIDGWKVTSGYAYLTSSGLYLYGTIVQTVDEDLSGTWTGSVLASDGAITPTVSTANKTFTITASGKTLYAAKLEKRASQTLYTGSGSSAVLVDGQPDIGLELLRCQRYEVVYNFNDFGSSDGLAFAALGTGATNAIAVLQLPAALRSTPTSIIPTSLYLYDGASFNAVTAAAVRSLAGNQLALNFIAYDPTTAAHPYFLYGQTGGKLVITTY